MGANFASSWRERAHQLARHPELRAMLVRLARVMLAEHATRDVATFFNVSHVTAAKWANRAGLDDHMRAALDWDPRWMTSVPARVRPPKPELVDLRRRTAARLAETYPLRAVAAFFGVSHTTIRKWASQ